MSAFRRRTLAGGSGARPAAGVRMPPYSSPVPLLSTGIPALDDIMSGGGVLSGSLVTFVPCEQTAAASLADIGGKRAPDLGTVAADAYTDLFLSYATAKGLVSRHMTAVAGFDPDAFCAALMGTAGEESAQAAPQGGAQEPEKMNIAWRYDQLQRIDAPFQHGDEAFCATFDLSRRIAPGALEQLRADGTLHTMSRSLDDTIHTFEHLGAECRRRAQQGGCVAAYRSPVLRMSIRGLGSPLFGGSPEEIVRFLWRMRRLLRTLALPEDGPPVPCVANISLSSALLSQGTDANLIHRIGHLSDGCIGLSSFASMREAAPDYTGALRVFRTPAIGTLTNPSLRSSVLRGMGAGMYPASGSSGRVEGGAGGGENNLAFKVKRKRVAIETLHLDAEGGVSERRTKPPSNIGNVETPARTAPPGAPAQPDVPATAPPAQAAPAAAPAAAAPATAANPRRTFALKSLRERGQSAAAQHDF